MVAILLVCLAVSGYFYLDTGKTGKRYLERVGREGCLLGESDSCAVYYLDQNLYYIAERGTTEKKFYLHCYPDEASEDSANEYGFVNSDFYFDAQELKTCFWSGKQIARISLNRDYTVEEIETGQFDEQGREWTVGASIKETMAIPDSIVPADLSDSNWTNGISSDGMKILLPAEEFEARYLSGCQIKLKSGKTTVIEKVEKEGAWLHLTVSSPIDLSDGYPNPIQITGS